VARGRFVVEISILFKEAESILFPNSSVERAMASPTARINPGICKLPPPLPLDAEKWAAVATAMGLSRQQTRVAELVLCDRSTKQIARVMKIGGRTVKTHLERIGERIGTHGRMQLAMRVLAISHELARDNK
jgi:DNA-binding NarL/FixJ family response regulator